MVDVQQLSQHFALVALYRLDGTQIAQPGKSFALEHAAGRLELTAS